MSFDLNDPRHPWARLTKAARTVRDERDAAVPFGFATRVAALALAQEQKMVSLFDRFALRALGVACLLALGSVALNYNSIQGAMEGPTSALAANSDADELIVPTTDTVAVVLDLAD